MAVTIALLERGHWGNGRCVTCDITGPASYTTGGEELTRAQLTALMPEYGVPSTILTGAAAINLFLSELDTAAKELVLDRATAKIMVFDGGTQESNGADLDAVVVRVLIVYGLLSDA